MLSWLRLHKLTVIGFIAAVLFWFISLITEMDLYEKMLVVFENLEAYEIDEVVFSLVIFVSFILAEQQRKNRKQKLEIEKLKIYKAMLGSTNHILNNFLTKMYLFKLIAEETKDFPVNALSLYDKIIDDVKSEINSLSNIGNIDEKSIFDSVQPKETKRAV